MKPFSLLSILLLLLLLILLSSTARAVPFKCTSSTATCQSIAGYIPANSTNLKGIKSLFQVPTLSSLLGANNLPLNTSSSYHVRNGTTVYVPFPCRCSNGTGVSDHTPVYTVRSTDSGLDAIARYTFDQFVTYQEIAKANGIKDPNVINNGERLWIPLPCSCDPVEEAEVVHLGHVVAAGSSVGEIAKKFGTTEEVLLKLNGMSDPKMLQAGQVLDVPLKACNSTISSTSLDHGLLLPKLPNGSYAVTAENCIQCSCSSSSNYQLSCKPIQGLRKSQCPVALPKCGDLSIGDSTSQGCKLTTCAYQGYTNSTGLNILHSLKTESGCNNGAPAPQPAVGNPPPGGNPPPSFGGRLSLEGHQIVLLLLLQIALFWFSF